MLISHHILPPGETHDRHHTCFQCPLHAGFWSRSYVKDLMRMDGKWDIDICKDWSISPLDTHSFMAFWTDCTQTASNVPAHNSFQCYSPYDSQYGFLAGEFTLHPFSPLWDLGHRANRCTMSAPSNPHYFCSWNGGTTNSSQLRPASRSVLHSMCLATHTINPLHGDTHSLFALIPAHIHCLHKKLIYTKSCTKSWLHITDCLASSPPWCKSYHAYPNLIHDLSFGSPIGKSATISFNVYSKEPSIWNIHLNTSLILLWRDMSGCMDGLYIEDAHTIYGVISGHVPLAWLKASLTTCGWSVISLRRSFGIQWISWVTWTIHDALVYAARLLICEFPFILTTHLCHLYTVCIFYMHVLALSSYLLHLDCGSSQVNFFLNASLCPGECGPHGCL